MVIFQPERFLLKKQIEKFASHIKGEVLDVGAGERKRYAEFFGQAKKYLTMDINPENNPDIVGRAEKIPLGDDSVDSIVCTQVLGDVFKLGRAIKEFSRVLRRNGILLLTESLAGEMHDEPHDYWRFTKFSLKKLLERNNFKIIAVDQRGGFFSTVAQIKIRYLLDRWHLYDHKIIGRIFNYFFLFYGRGMIMLDGLDSSRANRKHALGWCVVAKKL